jgi:hypothetical protein
MRRGLLLLPLSCILLVACSSGSSGGSGNGPAVIPTPSTVPSTGTQAVYVLSVDPKAHKITVDPIEYLTGEAATKEFKKMYPAASRGPANDYVIVNLTQDHIVLPLAASAPVRVVQAGGVDHNDPVPTTQSAFAHYSGLRSRPFWITTSRGTVTDVKEQFIP